MSDPKEKPVGQTKETGWQIGVRRTLSLRSEDAWTLLTSRKGIEAWLGATSGIDFSAGATYALADGTAGEVRVFSANSHLRITWRPKNWPKASTIQVRVIPNNERCVIAFHQEHLPGPQEREERRAHFIQALDVLQALAGME